MYVVVKERVKRKRKKGVRTKVAENMHARDRDFIEYDVSRIDSPDTSLRRYSRAVLTDPSRVASISLENLPSAQQHRQHPARHARQPSSPPPFCC